jgi:predicted nuclease of predicted toxin-antitoxin system
MNWSNFKFLTDENIDIEVVELLKNQGFDVFDIKEQALWGLSDSNIISMAFEEKRIIVTQDSDFGTMIYRDLVDFYGLIYLRPGHNPILHIQTLKTLFQSFPHEITIPFVLVAENINEVIKFRYRQF